MVLITGAEQTLILLQSCKFIVSPPQEHIISIICDVSADSGHPPEWALSDFYTLSHWFFSFFCFFKFQKQTQGLWLCWAAAGTRLMLCVSLSSLEELVGLVLCLAEHCLNIAQRFQKSGYSGITCTFSRVQRSHRQQLGFYWNTKISSHIVSSSPKSLNTLSFSDSFFTFQQHQSRQMKLNSPMFR